METLLAPTEKISLPAWMDAHFQSGGHGWIECRPCDEMVAKARDLRERRDRLHPNIFAEHATDCKWVGELAELCVCSWLHAEGLSGIWHQANAVGKSDITCLRQQIGVKAVKRKVPMRPEYTAQISARHAREKSDWFFFCCYEINRGVMVLLGGISPAVFLSEATYLAAGHQVHAKYTIRPGHEIYNAPVAALKGPSPWLESLRSMAAA